MKTNQVAIAIVGVCAGLLIGILITPSFYSPPFMRGGWGMMGEWDDFGGETLDKHFIEEMIPHHEGAIAMAELALEKSARPEIRSLAEGIIEAQTTEIEQMQAWYQDWYGTAVPVQTSTGMMGMGHGVAGHMMSMEGDLDALAVASDFDREFIRQMIPHHEMAVMMARMLQAGTERSEMETLADQIITSQTREIEMMRGWYEEWE